MNGWRAAVLTISDRSARGEQEDRSGPLLVELLGVAGFDVVGRGLVPDDVGEIAGWMRQQCDESGVALICTTGGTGIAARDVTPEAIRSVIEREVPGIGEAMRSAGLHQTPMAMLSRSLAGIRGRTLIITFPGSPRAVQESFEAIAAVLPHACELLAGRTGHNP